MKSVALSEILSKGKHRTKGEGFRPRKRKEPSGELFQGDATPYEWFPPGTHQALHSFMDDATGKITAIYQGEYEWLIGSLERLLPSFGIYADTAGMFFVNTKKHENVTIEEQFLDKTQFGATWKMGYRHHSRHTPQATMLPWIKRLLNSWAAFFIESSRVCA